MSDGYFPLLFDGTQGRRSKARCASAHIQFQHLFVQIPFVLRVRYAQRLCCEAETLKSE